jgi:hypothetical protein
MSKLNHKKSLKNATPKHLKKVVYKRATRKQVKLMRELNIEFHPDISCFSASALISSKLGKENNSK